MSETIRKAIHSELDKLVAAGDPLLQEDGLVATDYMSWQRQIIGDSPWNRAANELAGLVGVVLQKDSSQIWDRAGLDAILRSDKLPGEAAEQFAIFQFNNQRLRDWADQALATLS